MAEHPARVERPLSPHLQIYRLTFTFLMSGFHRVTGIVTYLGFILIVWWLVAAAAGPNDYAWVQWFFGTWLGRLVLLGFSWGLIHHSLGGIRHLIWDTGRGFEPHEREWLARATLIGSISLTLLAWIIGGFVMGGLR
jgi:succinate dehydrogenase cytochrome b subunit